MDQTILGIVEIVVGCVLTIFGSQFAQLNVKLQKDNFNIKLGDENNRATARSARLVGAILLILGVLTLLGIASWGVRP